MKMKGKSIGTAGFLACLLTLIAACSKTEDSAQLQPNASADDKGQAAVLAATPQVAGRGFQTPTSCHELSFVQLPVDNGKFKNVAMYGCEEATVAELSATFRPRLEEDGFKLQDAGAVVDDDKFSATKAGSMKLTVRLTAAKKPVDRERTLARVQWFIAGQ